MADQTGAGCPAGAYRLRSGDLSGNLERAGIGYGQSSNLFAGAGSGGSSWPVDGGTGKLAWIGRRDRSG